MRLYPRIPVANGFCMFIKREVLDTIGYFDAETFGRGYGEENDFCYRALQAGYCHVMCDDTYIYHSGTASFVSEEKQSYISEHEKILNQRYPKENHNVALHCQTNPNERVQENIKIWMSLLNGKKNILYLVQADFRPDADDCIGGTQLHTKDMTDIMRKNYNVFVAARNRSYLNFTAYTDDKEFTFKFFIGAAPEYPEFRNKKLAGLYGRLLDTFGIDIVHIQHTKNLSLEMYYQAEQKNIPLVATLHDYYTVCPMIKMINSSGALCAYCTENRICSECQQKSAEIYSGTDYITLWQTQHRKALAKAQRIVTPSECAKDIIAEYYPELKDKFVVIPHGEEQMYCKEYDCADRFNVAFIGGISNEKGSYACSVMVKNGPSDVHWHLFGIPGNNELSMLEKSNYTKTGAYQKHQLPDLFEKYKIDLVCILPIWPETYCYTLSEAVMCGIPVIATDIGALSDRVKNGGFGWLVPVENAAEESIAIINRIKNKGEEYRAKKLMAVNTAIKTKEEMKADYQNIYSSVMGTEKSRDFIPADIRFAVSGYLLSHGRKMDMDADSEQIQKMFEEMEEQINTITNSFTYKCVCKIRKLPVPGKKYIKKLIYTVYGFIKRKS